MNARELGLDPAQLDRAREVIAADIASVPYTRNITINPNITQTSITVATTPKIANPKIS